MTDPPEIDPCPYCGSTIGVQSTPGTPPRVQAWSCTACGTDWAISVVNPRPYLDRLTLSVELAAARSALPALTDDQLWALLAELAGRPCLTAPN